MRDWLMRKALDAARRRAGLQTRELALPFGTLVYQASVRPLPGVPLVLLHGACADHSSWLAWAQALARTPAGRRPLLVPDLPAHGQSTLAPDADLGISAQAQRLLDWLDALGVQRIHLLGHSMGGALALRLAQLRPGLVVSLVLIASAGVECRPSELREHVAQGHKHPMVEVDTLDDVRAMLGWGMTKPPWLPHFALQWLLDQKRPRRLTERKLLVDLERDQDQQAALAGLRLPTLILWGALDRVLHADNAAWLEARVAGSRKRVLPGVGHVPMVEATREVAAHCRDFLQDIDPV